MSSSKVVGISFGGIALRRSVIVWGPEGAVHVPLHALVFAGADAREMPAAGLVGFLMVEQSDGAGASLSLNLGEMQYSDEDEDGLHFYSIVNTAVA